MAKYKTLILLLGIVLLSFFSWRYMLKPGYFSMHDDMQFMRLHQMDKCFQDGQIPCRWVPDLGYEYGYPLFNFYPPLPYYVGQLVHLVFGFGFLDTSKIIFALGFVFSGIFMYFLAREFWGEIGGFLSAVFYIYAPYHAVDVYVRGAMAEHWALIWFPAILLSVYKVIKEKDFKWVLLLALSYGMLPLSHNIMNMIFSVVAAVWGFGWLIYTRNFTRIFRLAVGVIWGVGLASFFLLPVVFEKQFAHTETMVMGYFNFLAHYVSLKQLFIKTDWGWGASVYGADDGMPFMVGILHWVVPLISLVLAFVYWRTKDSLGKLLALLFALAFLFGTAFMAHERSTFIWTTIKPLEYVQFPWRFLGPVIFFASFAVGSIVLFFQNTKLRLLISAVLIIGLLYTVRVYFQPEAHYNIKDSDRLSGKEWQLGITNAIFDYLPVYATYPPPGPAPKVPEILDGEGKVVKLEKGSNWQKAEVEIASESAQVRFSLYDFPGWKVTLDGKETSIDHDNYLGLITVTVPEGKHLLEARLHDTPVRKAGNTISLLSFTALILSGLKIVQKKK